MFKPTLVVSAFAALALVVPSATATSDRANASCHPGQGAHDGWCVDPTGDVGGAAEAAGPDITRVDEFAWGTVFFKVTFAKAGGGGARSPLAHFGRWEDQVSVILTARGAKGTKNFRLTLFATDLTHEVLQPVPSGRPVLLSRYGGAGSRNSVTLALDPRPYVGDVREVRYRIEAARVARNGDVAGSDVVPDKGTTVYYGD